MSEAGATPAVGGMTREPIQAFAPDEYDEPRRLGTLHKENALAAGGNQREGENTATPIGREAMNTEKSMTATADPHLLSGEEAWAAYQARAGRFAVEHPEVLEAKPAWAHELVVDYVEDDGTAHLIFEASFGSVSVTRSAKYVDGLLLRDEVVDVPYVSLDRWDKLTVADMRQLASDLMAAIATADAVFAEVEDA